MPAPRTKNAGWSWEAAGAVCCFGGGIIAGLIGSVFTAITWFIGPQLHPWLRGTGTVLLIATIPLLIISGYFLDWGEGKKGSVKPQTIIGSHFEDGNSNDLGRD